MNSNWIVATLTGILVLPGSAQLRPQQRFELRVDHLTQMIVRALAEQGRVADPEHIALLGSVTANEPDPLLEIRSIQRVGSVSSDTISVRLACHKAFACLPFYALVSNSVASAEPSLVPTQTAQPSIIMPAGTRATLLMEDDRTFLRLFVISLESGIAGHTIRVRSIDRKKVYLAEVVSPTTLRGGF
jgi:hypothetical protein